MTQPLPEVGLVLPVYNGEPFIADSIRTVLATFDEHGIPIELVIPTDGCTDGTADAARSVDDPRVRVLEFTENRGKGAVVTEGLLVANGRWIGWLDADLDIHPETIVRMVGMLRQGDIDIVVGSKRHPDSVVSYPLIRRVYSAGYQALVRVLARVSARDTQVGAKLMRREVAEVTAPLLLVKRYAFDLEVLAVAAQFGFDRVEEAPITLEYRFSGTGIDRRAIWLMMLDTLAISYRLHIRHWYTRQFAALHRRRVEESSTAVLATDVLVAPISDAGQAS
ncbi:MAG: glycosyltransferase family 2 protein [Solirubrobacteraceae bacterium]|nr:glycosyltransferase family 2 protein [Solirubrobacteraceae bacterium]